MIGHRTGLRLLVALLGALVVVGCAGDSSDTGGAASPDRPASTATSDLRDDAAAETATVRVGKLSPLHVEVARSAAERARGLSGREGLAPGTGMIFVYDQPTTAEFWMRGVPFPLSLAWVRDGRFIGSVEMTPCVESEGCRLYEPPAPFEVAIEARANTFVGVEPGTPVRIDFGRGGSR